MIGLRKLGAQRNKARQDNAQLRAQNEALEAALAAAHAALADLQGRLDARCTACADVEPLKAELAAAHAALADLQGRLDARRTGQADVEAQAKDAALAAYTARLHKCQAFVAERCCELMDVVRMQSQMLGEAAKNAALAMLFEDITQDTPADALYASALQTEFLAAPVVPCEAEAGFVAFSDPAELAALGRSGFRNNALVRSVTLPEGLCEIPPSFFFGCVSLRDVVIPSTLTKIGSYAFFGCKQLQRVCIRGAGLMEIGDFAFAGCEALAALELPDALSAVGVGAFRYCTSLETSPFGAESRLARLCSHAFQYCAGLRAFALPRGVETIETSLFYGCAALERLTVPAGIATVEGYAFAECAALRELAFESGDTVLQPHALSLLQKDVRLTLRGKPLPRAQAEEETAPIAVRQLAAVDAEDAPAEGAAQTPEEV